MHSFASSTFWFATPCGKHVLCGMRMGHVMHAFGCIISFLAHRKLDRSEALVVETMSSYELAISAFSGGRGGKGRGGARSAGSSGTLATDKQAEQKRQASTRNAKLLKAPEQARQKWASILAFKGRDGNKNVKKNRVYKQTLGRFGRIHRRILAARSFKFLQEVARLKGAWRLWAKVSLRLIE